ncbi:MAG: metallophosphoesterase [Lentisphaerae bacterium]|nr:metallophosphoesterase [Lentisphaerota bacterium]
MTNMAIQKRLAAFIVAAALLGGCRLPTLVIAPPGTSAGAGIDLLSGIAPSFLMVKPDATSAWQDNLELSQADFDKLKNWEMPPEFAIKKRYLFFVSDHAAFIGLELNKPVTAAGWTLNGKLLPTPLAGQKYATVPGIPTSLLKPGTNELIGVWTRDELQSFCYKREKKPAALVKQALQADLGQEVQLLGLSPEALALQSGPVIGFAGTNFLAIACRLNLPEAVTLAMDGRSFESPRAFFHRFKVTGLKPDAAYDYTLSATCPGRAAPLIMGPFRARTLPAQAELTFAALGDSRSHPEIWGRVAKVLARHRPMFAVHTGDLVADGLEDPQWDLQCFAPAADLFASIPTFTVAGNHEQNSQVYYRMFSIPDGETNWVLEVGPVLFVGLNDISANSAAWLDSRLAASLAKFIFMVCHYPIMSSSDRAPPIMRQQFLPVLIKHRVTAEIAGHDHYYERSELPEGLSVIVTGGAGADLYKKKQQKPDEPPVNPYSQAFLGDFHFCIFRVKGNTCSLEAMTLDGKVFDRRVWPERDLGRRPADASLSFLACAGQASVPAISPVVSGAKK